MKQISLLIKETGRLDCWWVSGLVVLEGEKLFLFKSLVAGLCPVVCVRTRCWLLSHGNSSELPKKCLRERFGGSGDILYLQGPVLAYQPVLPPWVVKNWSGMLELPIAPWSTLSAMILWVFPFPLILCPKYSNTNATIQRWKNWRSSKICLKINVNKCHLKFYSAPVFCLIIGLTIFLKIE